MENKTKRKLLTIAVALVTVFVLIGALIVFLKSNSRGGLIGEDTKEFAQSANPLSTNSPLPNRNEVSNRSIFVEVVSPKDGATLNSFQVKLVGKTLPNADVFVNDQEVKVNANGEFSIELTLDEGENIVSVVANDENGNYAEKEITLNL